MELRAWDANDTAATWKGPWGGVGGQWPLRPVLPSASSTPLPPPLQQHLGNLFLLHRKRCPGYSWKPRVPSDLSLASTPRCQRRSPGTGCPQLLPEGREAAEGSGQGSAALGSSSPKMLPPQRVGRQGGRAGVHGGRQPLGFTSCNGAALTSISRGHRASGTFGEGMSPRCPWLGHLGQRRSAFGGFICFWGAQPQRPQTGCAGPGRAGSLQLSTRRRHVPVCFCWMNSPAMFAGA